MSFETIGDFVDLQRGNTYKSSLLGQPGPYLLGLGSIARDGGFRGEKLKTYGGPSDERMLVSPGDLYVSLKDVTQSGDLLGAIARVPPEIKNGRMTQDTVKLIFKKEISKDYFYWLLRAPQYREYCRSRATGTTNLGLSREDFFNFPVPSLDPKKKSLVTILEACESKITLNTQINQTLEQMAQALFKSWFVDFDPVIDNALEAGNLIPEPLAERAARRQAMRAAGNESAPARLPAETRRLFPDRFEEDDVLGWVPVEWNSGCISDVCKINAKSWTAKNMPPSVNYVDLANTKSGVIEETTWFDFAEAPSRARRVLSPGDTIIGTVRPGNRSYALVGGAKDQLTGSTGFAVLTPNSKELVEFVYLAVTREEVIEEFAHLADGGAYPAIKPSVVGDAKVVIPSKEILFLFNKFLAPMFIKYQDNLRENCTLKNLRDTLLPKLLSGELQLPEAEAAVETALEVEPV